MIVNKLLDRPAVSLPPKNHFSLYELAERWHAPIADVQYYAVHGMLEVQVWLSLPGVRIKHSGSSTVARLDDYEGYIVVEVKDLRRIFRSDGTHNRILPEDLVVSREERDRFESTHGIKCHFELDANTVKPATHTVTPVVSFPGRPSVMRRITAHFEERCEKRMLERSLQKEGDYLVTWADEHIADVQIPTARSIRNAIRTQYREYSVQVSEII